MADQMKSQIKTFSRFSVLEIDSDDENSRKQDVNEKNTKSTKNSKKKANKKKKKSSDAELRNLAFSKPVSAATIQSVHQKNHPLQEGSAPIIPPPPPSLLSKKKGHTQNGVGVGPPGEKSWQDWKNNDEKFVTDQFQHDLETALRLSSNDAGSVKKQLQHPLEQKKKRSQKNHAMSLEEFTQLKTSTIINEQAHSKNGNHILSGYSPEELDPSYFEVENDNSLGPKTTATDPITSNQSKKKNRKKKNKGQDKKTTLSDMLTTENTNGSADTMKSAPGLDAASMAIYQNNLELKLAEIEQLKDENKNISEELTQVKRRNKQLCFILAQGEMKEKSEILQQVDELNNIKTELSAELESVCSELEQERSKVSHLKQEVAKHQGSRTHTKSMSEEKTN